MSHPYLTASRTPRVFAHRGLVTAELAACGIVENSRAAIEAAISSGSTYVETDCHVTSDGVIVLFHDADLARVTGDPRMVAEVTAAELTTLMADRGGLLTLEEMLAMFPDTKFNIDVKAPAAAVRAGTIVGPHGDRVLLTSFHDATRRTALAAAEAHGARPATSPGRLRIASILLALALGSRSARERALRGLDALQVPERHRGVPVLSDRLIDAAHTAGVEVHVWTVNEAPDMQRLVRRGVDGLITDRADLALSLFE